MALNSFSKFLRPLSFTLLCIVYFSEILQAYDATKNDSAYENMFNIFADVINENTRTTVDIGDYCIGNLSNISYDGNGADAPVDYDKTEWPTVKLTIIYNCDALYENIHVSQNDFILLKNLWLSFHADIVAAGKLGGDSSKTYKFNNVKLKWVRFLCDECGEFHPIRYDRESNFFSAAFKSLDPTFDVSEEFEARALECFLRRMYPLVCSRKYFHAMHMAALESNDVLIPIFSGTFEEFLIPPNQSSLFSNKNSFWQTRTLFHGNNCKVKLSDSIGVRVENCGLMFASSWSGGNFFDERQRACFFFDCSHGNLHAHYLNGKMLRYLCGLQMQWNMNRNRVSCGAAYEHLKSYSNECFIYPVAMHSNVAHGAVHFSHRFGQDKQLTIHPQISLFMARSHVSDYWSFAQEIYGKDIVKFTLMPSLLLQKECDRQNFSLRTSWQKRFGGKYGVSIKGEAATAIWGKNHCIFTEIRYKKYFQRNGTFSLSLRRNFHGQDGFYGDFCIGYQK
ncbi:MAG: hypothetical protein LBI69_05160 [Puniceicoccales bacterium]|jgi:hypothetical protein|nr:hypothetical protein [Puniceicoccales bacterium]